MSQENRAFLWLGIIAAFFVLRAISVSWVEPWLQSRKGKGIDRHFSLETAHGTRNCLIASALFTLVLALLPGIYQLFGHELQLSSAGNLERLIGLPIGVTLTVFFAFRLRRVSAGRGK